MLRVCHWAALLAICYWAGYVAAAPLPSVQWSRLSVWEASALADVWTRASEYLDFRSYALCGLSDLGYFDHPLDDFAPTLRVLASSLRRQDWTRLRARHGRLRDMLAQRLWLL